MPLENIVTDRLYLIPYTCEIIRQILLGDYTALENLGLNIDIDWPDEDVLETLPRILANLSKVNNNPSGFESWIIVQKQGNFVIGDIGFKGKPNGSGEIDLGYGLIKSARKKGFTNEAGNALIKWAFMSDDVVAITANCHVDNIGSINVLRGLKFSLTS